MSYRLWRFHIPPTSTRSWSKIPKSVDAPSALWFDLLLVGVLYRLVEFIVTSSLLNSNGPSAFWVPTGIFFAVYDAWLARPLFETFFRRPSTSFLHAVANLTSWLLLAVMASSLIPSSTTPPGVLWTLYNARVFGALKFVLALIRVLEYLGIFVLSTRASSRASIPHLICYAISLPVLLLAPILTFIDSLGDDAQIYSSLCWVLAYIIQRVVYVSVTHGVLKKNELAMLHQPNLPYLERRHHDWISLQLGQGVLSLCISPTASTVSSLPANEYFFITSAFVYFACQNLFFFSQHSFGGMATEREEEEERRKSHALQKGWLGETAWSELMALEGFALLGVASGLRAMLFYPEIVVNGKEKHMIVLFVACALLDAQTMLFQELIHSRKQFVGWRIWWLKVIISFGSVIAPLSMWGFGTEDNTNGLDAGICVSIVVLGQAITSATVLGIQALAGGFRIEVMKRKRVTLRGAVLASVVGRMWLDRARARIRRRQMEASGNNANANTVDGVIVATGGGTTDNTLPRNEQTNRGRRVPNSLTLLTRVVGAHFWERPQFYNVGDVFVEYGASWCDVFFDLLFVGVLFNMGSFLSKGLGFDTSTGVNADNSAVWLYAAIFISTLGMWQTKLNLQSKLGVSDVAHKIIDSIQGYSILVCALNVGTPSRMRDYSTGTAWGFAAGTSTFYAVECGLWAEAPADRLNQAEMRLRNLTRSFLSLGAACLSFVAIGLDAPLEVTCVLWFCTWFAPLGHRLLLKRCRGWGRTAGLARCAVLNSYTIHRLGENALLMLGEGVLQILRAKSEPDPGHYVSFFEGFSILVVIRFAQFSMDEFHDVKRHCISSGSVTANLLSHMVRSVGAPGVVAAGVAVKVNVDLITGTTNTLSFVFLAIGSVISLASFFLAHILHRWSFHKLAVHLDLFIKLVFCFSFFLWPWLGLPDYGDLSLVLLTWIAGVILYWILDNDVALSLGRTTSNNAGTRVGGGTNAAPTTTTTTSTLMNFFSMGGGRGEIIGSPRTPTNLSEFDEDEEEEENEMDGDDDEFEPRAAMSNGGGGGGRRTTSPPLQDSDFSEDSVHGGPSRPESARPILSHAVSLETTRLTALMLGGGGHDGHDVESALSSDVVADPSTPKSKDVGEEIQFA